jgi:hypothetical protein
MANPFLICVNNDGYEVSLERRKLYEKVRDRKAESHGMVRIIDESGDAYLYPEDCFLAVKLPAPIHKAVRSAA